MLFDQLWLEAPGAIVWRVELEGSGLRFDGLSGAPVLAVGRGIGLQIMLEIGVEHGLGELFNEGLHLAIFARDGFASLEVTEGLFEAKLDVTQNSEHYRLAFGLVISICY